VPRLARHPWRSAGSTALATGLLLFFAGADATTCVGAALGAGIGLRLWALLRTPSGPTPPIDHAERDVDGRPVPVVPRRGNRTVGAAYLGLALAVIPLSIAGVVSPNRTAVSSALLAVLGVRRLLRAEEPYESHQVFS
jgi:hypothetical protein